jgi:hypothetical protein
LPVQCLPGLPDQYPDLPPDLHIFNLETLNSPLLCLAPGWIVSFTVVRSNPVNELLLKPTIEGATNRKNPLKHANLTEQGIFREYDNKKAVKW